MKDYRDMTIWELQEERDKILEELVRRYALANKARELMMSDADKSTDIGESPK